MKLRKSSRIHHATTAAFSGQIANEATTWALYSAWTSQTFSSTCTGSWKQAVYSLRGPSTTASSKNASKWLTRGRESFSRPEMLRPNLSRVGSEITRLSLICVNSTSSRFSAVACFPTSTSTRSTICRSINRFMHRKSMKRCKYGITSRDCSNHRIKAWETWLWTFRLDLWRYMRKSWLNKDKLW